MKRFFTPELHFRRLFLSLVAAVLAPFTAGAQQIDADASSLGGMLKGRTAGVMVRNTDASPGSAFSVIVRGLKSFRGSSAPLFVLNGVVLNPQGLDTEKTFWYDDTDYQIVRNTLEMIDPRDIGSITVLKDAAATAIYGMQGGANGVVLIMTKKGSTNRPTIRWNGDFSFSTLARPKQMLGLDEYRKYAAVVSAGAPALPADLKPVDWQKEGSRTAFSQKQYVGISGKTQTLNYYISGIFRTDEGVVDRSRSRLGSLRFDVEARLGTNARMGFNALLAYDDGDMVQSVVPLGGTGNISWMTLGRPYAHQADYGTGADPFNVENYDSWRRDYDDISREYRVIPSFFVEFDLAKWLKWRTTASVDYSNRVRTRWIGTAIRKGWEKNAIAGRSTSSGMRYDLESYLAFDKNWGRHLLRAQTGISLFGTDSRDKVTEGYDFIFKSMRGTGVSNAQQFPGGKGSSPVYNLRFEEQFRYAGYVTATYSYGMRYEVTATLRADAAGRYNDFNDMDYSPAVGVKWNIANEKFMSGCRNVVSTLSLRAGWGRSGNQSIESYRNIYRYTTPDSGYPYPEIVTGMSDQNFRMRWKLVNEQCDAGLEAVLFKERLSVVVNYYDSESTDRLSLYFKQRRGDAKFIPGSSSVGKVRNRGWEAEVSGSMIRTKRLEWSAGANITFNRSKILQTGAGYDYAGNSVGRTAGDEATINGVMCGTPVGAFYGYRTAGLVTAENAIFAPSYEGRRLVPGDVMLVDRDGNGHITSEDRTVIGNPNPKFFGGFYTSLRYRNWEFGLSFEAMYGNDVMNLNRLSEDDFSTDNLNNISRAAFRNAWSSENPSGNYPRMDAVGRDLISDRLVEDGSYLRLSDIRVGYTVPLPKNRYVRKLQVAFSVRNAFVLTSYSGYDPDVNCYGYDPLRWGADYGSYPAARTYLLSIGANF